MSQPQAPMTGHTLSPASESPLRACVVIPVYDHPATIAGVCGSGAARAAHRAGG